MAGERYGGVFSRSQGVSDPRHPAEYSSDGSSHGRENIPDGSTNCQEFGADAKHWDHLFSASGGFKAKKEPDTHEDKRADPEAGVLDTRIINIDEDSDP